MNDMTCMNDTAEANDGAARQVAAILAPLSVEAPCGAPAHGDPAFTEIRLLREEDDPGLPMRQWERPLRQADWARIEALCVEMLAARSKHLQIAMWLLEAWTRQHGYPGLARGLHMIDALLRSYWADLHPAIEADGDCDLRLAPLEWLNASLGTQLHVHAPLLPLAGCRPPFLTLAAWDRLAAADHGITGEAGEAPLTRTEVAAIAARSPAAVRGSSAAVAQCLASLRATDGFLRSRLEAQAPNLARLADTLEGARRVLGQLASPDPGEAVVYGDDGSAFAEVPAPVATALAAPAPPAATWRNRAQAYATLDALAGYLADIEPHSPVPFLLRRALHWGALPLPELLAEILREEGDLNRLASVLGMKV